MTIDREFTIKEGDIIVAPPYTHLAQIRTSYGHYIMRDIGVDMGAVENMKTSRDWIKWFDELWGTFWMDAAPSYR